MDSVPLKDWGPAPRGLFLLALLLGLTALLNWRAVERDPATGQPAILEAESVWRLRRISLAIETSRLAQSDSFLSFPTTATSVDLPLYDEALALALRAFTGGRVGAPQRPVDEGLLMRAAWRVGPVLGLVLCLALYGWLRRLGVGSARSTCLAVLWCAALPTFLGASEPGILSIELLAVLEALAVGSLLVAVFRSPSSLDRFTLGMVAGGVCGIGLITTPLFLLIAFAAWCAFFFEALRCEGDERTEWVRAFLLFWITAALGSQLPSLGGPWLPSQSGNPHGWAELAQGLILAGAAPFLLFLWMPKKDWRVPVRAVLPGTVVLVGAMALALALFFGADHPRLALVFGSVDWVAGQGVQLNPGAGLLGLCLLAALGVLRLLRHGSESWTAIGVLLTVWGSGSLLVASLHGPAGLLFLPVGAVIAGTTLAPGGRPVLGLGGLLLTLALCAWDSHHRHGSPDLEGLAILEGARELRESTPRTGAFNSVHPIHRWGVLADERTAPLVAWYGRRPCAVLGAPRNGDPQGRASLERALGAATPQEVREGLAGLGIRWSLLGTRSPGRLDPGGKNFPELPSLIDGEGVEGGLTPRQIALP